MASENGSPGLLQSVRVLFGTGTDGGLTDGQLLERILREPGPCAERAFRTLVQRHGPMVLGTCRSVLRQTEDSEDAFQATFLVLLKSARSIHNRDSLGPWLHGVARRVAIRAKANASRRSARERRKAEEFAEWSALDETLHDELRLLHEEIARLPARFQSAIVLCYLEGMTYETAAETLRLTEGTVRGRLVRAREILRTRLVRRGVTAVMGLSATAVCGDALASVPLRLETAATEAALRLVRGSSAGHVLISGSIDALTKGVLQSMFYTKLKGMIPVALTTGALAIAISVSAQPTAKPPRPAEAPLGNASGNVVEEVQDAKSRTDIDDSLVQKVGGRVIRTNTLTKDCMVLSYIPDWAHGDVDNLGVADNDGGVRTLLEWPKITAKDAGAGSNVRFVVALYSRKTTASDEAGPIHAFCLRSKWPERTSWKTLPEYDAEPAATFPFEPGDGWKVFDITSIVQAETKAGRIPHGILLRFTNEDRSSSQKNFSGYQFVSREGTGEWAKRRPVLLVVDGTKP